MNTFDFGFEWPFRHSPSTPVYLLPILDESKSMGLEDYPPNRLVAGTMAINAALDEKFNHRPQDKMGIVGFSENSRCICPFTKVTDRHKIVQSLQSVHPISSTDFVKGLNTARKMFEKEAGRGLTPGSLLKMLFAPHEPETSKQPTAKFMCHAIFLSDGEHTEKSDPIRAAKKLRQLGVLLDCIGIGGSPKDVDEECLKAMASIGPDGKPRYRFIGDTRALIQDFRRMATLQVI